MAELGIGIIYFRDAPLGRMSFCYTMQVNIFNSNDLSFSKSHKKNSVYYSDNAFSNMDRVVISVNEDLSLVICKVFRLANIGPR